MTTEEPQTYANGCKDSHRGDNLHRPWLEVVWIVAL
jgi:hypothetical protein